ncbi:related to threonine dehydratase [Cephalotrichum gorgonifer]|uniref:Related to threonine dehydratase n=1 Tax=Cephalotrichum gorgonifer TaxID=2041049 RepID=A0AAE8SRP5_9PEZI|nr:related to threonine dehydratase [Cephalotrichum gorgonifer]
MDKSFSGLPLTRASVQEAHKLIAPHVHRTPVFRCKTLDEIASTERPGAGEGGGRGARPKIRLWFKCENLQRVGAFKARGAFHAVGRLVERNHAQAVALAARDNGIPAHIIMPSIAMPNKIAGTKGYGATVYFSGSTAPEREAEADRVMKETGARMVPPYDHPDVILGQGTTGLELQEQVAEEMASESSSKKGLNAIITPCGGGGLNSGVALSCEGTGISVFAAEPTHQGADDLRRGLAAHSRITAVSSLSIADGLRTPVGAHPWSILHDRGLLRGAYAVSEEEISRALRLVLERMKVVVEPSAVVGLAVVLFNEEFRRLVEEEGGEEGWDIGVVFTGGNVNLDALPGLLELGKA